MPYNFKKLLKNESFSGHLNYSAPEILEHGQEHQLSSKVDIWSLGCCLYYLTTKRDPFDGANPSEIKDNIRNGILDRYEKDVGRDDRGSLRHQIIELLLMKCLTLDPRQRPSAHEIIDILDQQVCEHQELFDMSEEADKANQHDMSQGEDQHTHAHYQNKVMNKNIPEFFVKKNNHDPIIIQRLPFKYIMDKFDKRHSSQVEPRIERASHNIEEETTNAGGTLLHGKATTDENLSRTTQPME